MQLSVIIINYNVKYFLEHCLCSVAKAMKDIDGEIIVIDNNSSDGSAVFFQDKFPEVNFVWNSTNTGFAKANNQGIALARGEYILFLNPDTIIAEDTLEKSIAFIKKENNNCALGIKMLDGSGKFLKESKRAFPDPLTSLYKLSGLARVFPSSTIFGKYHLGFLDENKNHEVDVLAGAYMMVTRKILEKVKGFDEDYFMYGEDIDLSYRIQEAGFKNYYFSESTIIHFKGESTRKDSLRYVKMFYKAMSIFVKKHYGGSKAGAFNALLHVAIWARATMSAIVRFLKWVGLPVIDATLILASFWSVKLLWSHFVKQEVNYSPNMLLIAFPAFTLLFLLSTYFSGLYDSGYQQSRLNRSTVVSILILLSVYSLLPESLRFSRGILLFGSLTAFGAMSVSRILLLRWRIIEGASKSNSNHQIVIAGTKNEYEEAGAFLKNFQSRKNILGRISVSTSDDVLSIGNINELERILLLPGIKKIIFCEGDLSFKQIIDALPLVSDGISIGFFSIESHTLIGSNDKNVSGEFLSKESDNLHVAMKIYRRSKRLFDICVSLFFIISFPVHLLLKRRPFTFFKNTFKVLSGKFSWVGYAEFDHTLPPSSPGIITTTGLPAEKNNLSKESLASVDWLYAKHYETHYDLKLIRENYQKLS
ncbi:MAG: glycosyltransferase [Ginsengibacter sp.]